MTWNKIKFAGEVILFIVYLGAGMMTGWTLALGGSSLEKTVSTLSMGVALILLWGLHRRRNIFIWKIQTSLDGAIAGAIVGAARALTCLAIDRIIIKETIDWLILIGIGGLLGGLYGSLGEKKKRAG